MNKRKTLPKVLRIVLSILLIGVIVFAALFIYKKIYFDYTGEYAKETVVYSPDYGFAKTITYFEEYQKNGVDGFAVVNIPVNALFTDKHIKTHNETDNLSDSKEMLNYYQIKNVALNIKDGAYSNFLGEDISSLGSFLVSLAPKNVIATCNVNGKDYYVLEYAEMLSD